MKLTYPPESKPLEGYTIKRAVARGGFGEVYYALSDAGKEVALKLLRQNLEVELRGVSQCLNLSHPNLVSIFDIKTDKQGDHWIIMEYVSGKTLENVLDDSPGAMPFEEIKHWLSEISAGLTYLHSRGLVHRDLKPANIFEHQHTIKIGDVGLSKFISNSQANAQTQSVGTVYYMAPEVAHGRYGKPVDVYALGVMLFEMLTGEVPFDGESQAEILMKHLSEQPNLNQLHPRLRPVLARALEKDPVRRYQSSAELVREFERAVRDMEHQPDVVETQYPPGPPPRNHHPHTRYPQDRPPRNRRPEPVRERQAQPYDRHRYATAGEQPGGLGQMKWVLIGFVILFFFPRLMRMGFSGFLLMGGMLVALVYAFKRLSEPNLDRYVGPGQSPRGQHPRDRRPVQDQHSREEARYAAQQRRDQHRAAEEERRESVRRVREARRAEKNARRQHRRGYANVSPSAQRHIPLRQRVKELASSFTFAGVATVLITASLLLAASFLAGSRMVFFGAVTIFGAWTILGTAKNLEGKNLGWTNSRLIFLVAGLVVGLGAWFVASNLFITFNPEVDRELSRNAAIGSVQLSDNTGQPQLPGYVLFFAGLFALRRWGWHADAFRDHRFRLRSVLLTTAIGWLWAMIIGFPILWGVTWAAALSSVVQLSACWVPPEDRHRLMEAQKHE